jgi:prepilin-type N-terminal cleavage/methylation domain-containing protein
MNARIHRRHRAGFTLIETMIATLVLSIGLLGLSGILAQGLAYMNVSQYEYIAQEKAAETVESIFTARDQGQATWATICNVGSTVCSNGMFLTGALPLCDPNTDGIAGTSDDFVSGACPDAAHTDSILLPNSTTGLLTAPSRIPLTNYSFKRTITVSSVTGVSNLRTIQVTIS